MSNGAWRSYRCQNERSDKFWRIRRGSTGSTQSTVYTWWGRTGSIGHEVSRNHLSVGAADEYFRGKVREKEARGYVRLPDLVVNEGQDTPPDSGLDHFAQQVREMTSAWSINSVALQEFSESIQAAQREAVHAAVRSMVLPVVPPSPPRRSIPSHAERNSYGDFVAVYAQRDVYQSRDETGADVGVVHRMGHRQWLRPVDALEVVGDGTTYGWNFPAIQPPPAPDPIPITLDHARSVEINLRSAASIRSRWSMLPLNPAVEAPRSSHIQIRRETDVGGFGVTPPSRDIDLSRMQTVAGDFDPGLLASALANPSPDRPTQHQNPARPWKTTGKNSDELRDVPWHKYVQWSNDLLQGDAVVRWAIRYANRTLETWINFDGKDAGGTKAARLYEKAAHAAQDFWDIVREKMRRGFIPDLVTDRAEFSRRREAMLAEERRIAIAIGPPTGIDEAPATVALGRFTVLDDQEEL